MTLKICNNREKGSYSQSPIRRVNIYIRVFCQFVYLTTFPIMRGQRVSVSTKKSNLLFVLRCEHGYGPIQLGIPGNVVWQQRHKHICVHFLQQGPLQVRGLSRLQCFLKCQFLIGYNMCGFLVECMFFCKHCHRAKAQLQLNKYIYIYKTNKKYTYVMVSIYTQFRIPSKFV
jgi:hypothetical protein